MSWDAGAITGGLQFDIGQYVGAVTQATDQAHTLQSALNSGVDPAAVKAGHAMQEAAGHAQQVGHSLSEVAHEGHSFGEMLREHVGAMVGFQIGASALIELPLKLIEKAFELGVEAVHKFTEAIADVGNAAQKMGLEALTSGVSVEFFSQIAEEGKRTGVSVDALSNSFKFLQKNAVDAVNGASPEAAAGFEKIGISVDFLSHHLDDTQGMFEAVQQGMANLANNSQRVRYGMEVMGKGATEILPLFAQTQQQMEESAEMAARLGAGEEESSVQSAAGWVKSRAAFSDMWEGISKAAGEPILQYMTDHWNDIRHAIIDFADTAIEVIPVAFATIYGVMHPVLGIIAQMIEGMAGMAAIMDKVGYSNNAGEALMKLAQRIESLNQSSGEIVTRSAAFRDNWREREGMKVDGTGNTIHVHNQITYDPMAPEKLGQDIAKTIKRAGDKANQHAGAAIRRNAGHGRATTKVGGQPISIFDFGGGT